MVGGMAAIDADGEWDDGNGAGWSLYAGGRWDDGK